MGTTHPGVFALGRQLFETLFCSVYSVLIELAANDKVDRFVTATHTTDNINTLFYIFVTTLNSLCKLFGWEIDIGLIDNNPRVIVASWKMLDNTQNAPNALKGRHKQIT